MGKSINLGERVKDRITGYVGIATARGEHLDGTVRYGVEALVNGAVAVEWFDEKRLDVCDAA